MDQHGAILVAAIGSTQPPPSAARITAAVTRRSSPATREGLIEGSSELPPCGRSGDVRAFVAEKPRGKTVRWSPHLVTSTRIEYPGSRAGAECSAKITDSDDGDADGRPPRLPSAAFDLSKPRMPRGALDMLSGAGQATSQTGSQAGRKGVKHMEHLAEDALLAGSLLMCAVIRATPAEPSESTRSIKLLMKSLLEEEEHPATHAKTKIKSAYEGAGRA